MTQSHSSQEDFDLIAKIAASLPAVCVMTSQYYLLICFTVCYWRVVVLDKVADLLLFFGKLMVVAGVGKC